MAEATRHGIQPDFRKIFEAALESQFILTPDLFIMAASDTYLHSALRSREMIVGRYLFDVFPDHPSDPGATGMRIYAPHWNVSATATRGTPLRLKNTTFNV